MSAKRNIACKYANDKIIIYWYDDYWMADWCISYQVNKKPWAAGGTLCYTKALWKQNPFPYINIGVDTRFVWNVPEAHITRLHDNRFYVSIMFDSNTSAKRNGDRFWHTIDITRIQAILGEDYAFYAGIVEEV